MSILYKNVRNGRCVLFTKTSIDICGKINVHKDLKFHVILFLHWISMKSQKNL